MSTPNINKLPKSAFYAVPLREWNKTIECDSLVLLPSRSTALHDSGYRFMDAVAIADNALLCRVAGVSDVFHMERPSYIWTKNRTPSSAPSWNIDCLPRSGLFQIFIHGCRMHIPSAMSSMMIYPVLPL